jgi:hypothetical protein
MDAKRVTSKRQGSAGLCDDYSFFAESPESLLHLTGVGQKRVVLFPRDEGTVIAIVAVEKQFVPDSRTMVFRPSRCKPARTSIDDGARMIMLQIRIMTQR